MRIHVSSVPQSRRRKKLLLPKPSLKKGKLGEILDTYKDLPPYFKPQTGLFLQKLVTLIRYKTPTHPNSFLLHTAPLQFNSSTDCWVASRSSSSSTDASNSSPGSCAGCLQWMRWEGDATNLHLILHSNGCEESDLLFIFCWKSWPNVWSFETYWFFLNVCMWDAAVLWGEGADMHCERCARGIAINLPWDAILHGSSKH